MEWVDFSGEIVLQQLNRLQNTNDVWLADARDRQGAPDAPRRGPAWLDVVDSWQWLPAARSSSGSARGTAGGTPTPRRATGRAWRLLTPGDFDIVSVDGVDEKQRVALLHRLARRRDAPLPLPRAPRRPGHARARHARRRQAGTHAYNISPDGRFAIHTVSTIDRPPVTDLVQLPVPPGRSASSRTTRTLAAAVAPLLTPPTEFFQVDIGDGVTLDGWMIKPQELRPVEEVPAPHVRLRRAGRRRGHRRVVRRPDDRMLFHRALADAGYVVACVDNRGTPAPEGPRLAQDRSTARSASSRRRTRPPRSRRCSRRARTSTPSASPPGAGAAAAR